MPVSSSCQNIRIGARNRLLSGLRHRVIAALLYRRGSLPNFSRREGQGRPTPLGTVPPPTVPLHTNLALAGIPGGGSTPPTN